MPCGVGQRKREVVCVDNLGDIVADEECNMALRPQDLQNCDKGVCASSWFYSLWSDRVRNMCVFLWYFAVVLLKQMFISLCSVLQTVRKEVRAGRWCVWWVRPTHCHWTTVMMRINLTSSCRVTWDPAHSDWNGTQDRGDRYMNKHTHMHAEKSNTVLLSWSAF